MTLEFIHQYQYYTKFDGPKVSAQLSLIYYFLRSKDLHHVYDLIHHNLIRQRADQLGDAILIGYPQEGVTDYEEHSAIDLNNYADAAAASFVRKGLKPVNPALNKAPVIGLLAQSSLHYIVSILGLSRLGYAALLLSTRLAGPGLKRLLELAECETLLATEFFHPILEEVQKEQKLEVLEFLKREEYRSTDGPVLEIEIDREKEHEKVAIIIHSSGSTGLPKPIYLTHKSCLGAFATHLDMRALHTSPLFHSHAFYEMFRNIFSGKPIYFCNYGLPFTKDNLMVMIEHVKPEIFHCVPYILKLLAESEEGVRCLAKAKVVQYGGSACPDDLGDRLVQEGVMLVGNYGATETGRLMNSVRPPGDLDWNYMRILPQVQKYVLMDEIALGTYECVALDGLKSKSTVNSDDPPNSFRTRDLFMPHPRRPGLWKYLSRLDDRFTITMGEKVLPILMEGRIRQESLVKEACVFGEGRTVPGVLIAKADSAAHLSDDHFLAQIWPAIEDANQRAETFARIPRELVVVLPADIEYPKTDKGTFIRAQMYSQFASQVNAAYTSFEGDDKGGTLEIEGTELESWLVETFQRFLDMKLAVETDFFSAGVDSLMCIKMWNFIKKEVNLAGRQGQLGQNVLYETGCIRNLARSLETLRRGEAGKAGDVESVMSEMIEKYSMFESAKTPEREEYLDKEVVLLTGVTGGLGAHLLAQLVANSNVSAVWCLVRAPSDIKALERVRQSLKARSLDIGSTQERKIIALASDLSKFDFDLDCNKLEQLKSKLTLCIHSAWAVNFNLSVSSFEAQHIAAVHNLLSLCHSTSAKFFFCSSVSVAGGTPRPGNIPEKPIENVNNVQSTGYAQSKYVAEWITVNAAKMHAIDAKVLRVGQLIGDTKIGEWNVNEGVPMLIQTATTIGALPRLDEDMSWLPIDYAASIILDLTHIISTDSQLVYHVLNPNLFHWTRDMLPALAAAGLEFETLPTEEWMGRLRASDKDPKKNPPMKLLDWFESKYGDGAKAKSKGKLIYETKGTGKDSVVFKKLPNVTHGSFVKMLTERLRMHWTEGSNILK